MLSSLPSHYTVVLPSAGMRPPAEQQNRNSDSASGILYYFCGDKKKGKDSNLFIDYFFENVTK